MMIVIYDKIFKRHKAPDHIERPSRLKAIIKAAKEENIKIEKPYSLSKKIFKYLNLAHSWGYIKTIRKIFKEAYINRKIIYIDSDTYISPWTWKASYKAVFSVIKAIDLSKEFDKIFCVVRPPGHHAGKEGIANTISQGFCIFNNVAIGSMYAKKYYKKILILDIDLHHGNGTEDIVKNNKKIKFISIHAKNIYPGTGYESYNNIYNFSLELGSGDKEYIYVLENKIFPIIEEYNPDIILVSLGFDAHKEDPLSPLNVTLESYKKIFEFLKKFKVIYVLEGGYNLKILYQGSKLLFSLNK